MSLVRRALLLVLFPLAFGCAPSDDTQKAAADRGGPGASLTADDIVARAAENWGGAERIRTLRTIRASFTYNAEDGPVVHEVARPNRVRSTGGQRYTSVFDGRRAGFLRFVKRDGTPSEPFLAAEDEWKDWELEAAWVFPAFFDHPAEYLGLQERDGIQAHVLRVALPLGARVDYFLDAGTFLVIRAEGLATIGGKTYASARTYHDFRPVDGVLYPTRMTYFYGEPNPQAGTIDEVAFDVEFPADYFAVPDSIG